jgi:pyruvate formate lyase activating enzyme
MNYTEAKLLQGSAKPGEGVITLRYKHLVFRVDVLPFHQLNRYKWEKLGMDYKLRDAEPPSQEKIDQVLARFRAAGLNVV